MLLVLLSLAAVAQAQNVQWIVQNFYNGAACQGVNLASTTAWRADVCSEVTGGMYRKYTCEPGGLNKILSCTTSDCEDSSCTVSSQIAADVCGNTGPDPQTAAGSFYTGCNVEAPADEPPAIDSVSHAVYETFTYINSTCGNPILQRQSFVSGACSLRSINTCTSATQGTSQLFGDYGCENATTGVTNVNTGGACVGGGSSACRLASDPTTSPQPGSPTAAPLIAPCADARSRDQCSATVPLASGAYTLPTGSPGQKCCVWCGADRNNNTDGTCHEPSWTQDTSCSCPAGNNGTLTTNDLLILGCPASIQVARCKCINKFPGLPECGRDDSGGIPPTSAPTQPPSAGASYIAGSLFLALLIAACLV